MSNLIEVPDNKIWLPPSYEIYVKPTEEDMSRRKLEGLNKLAEIQNWGRRRPDRFINEFIGFELLDVQEYILMNSWTTPNCLWLESRGSGKSTMIAIYIMAKSLLYNNYVSYIASGSSDQAIETFMKIEAIAKDALESATGLTKEFLHELKISQSSGDGFTHNPMGYAFTTWNGSKCTTLNSNVDKKRGKRANLVVFDETGFLPEEMLAVYAAFTAVKKEFKLGKGTNVKTLPRSISNQLIYASSASSVDTPYYSKVLDFTKKRIIGDPNYFICDISCDIMTTATYKGEKYPVPLLSQEQIDSETRANAEKANREFRNIFTQDGGQHAIIKRSVIARNSFVRPPILFNDTGRRKFVFAYDSARSCDNSILTIAELRKDPVKGYMLDIVNCISFIDTSLKKKTPLMYQEQIVKIRETLIDYNGGEIDYSNIECFLADAGAGGGGNSWVVDSLIEEFRDNKGKLHKGLIDKEYSSEYVRRFPNNINILKMVEPSKYKSIMAEATIKMIEADLITFPEVYENKGYLNIIETDKSLIAKSEKEIRAKLDKMNLPIDKYEKKLMTELTKINACQSTLYKLSVQEEIALGQINLLKEELVNICRVPQDGGKDKFKLPAHKDANNGASESTMHDDRFYTFIMLAWFLSEKRVEHIRKRNKPEVKEANKYFKIRAPKRNR